jgi:hypothetical protein
MAPWLWFIAQVSVNGDVIWLTHAAERILAGQTMATDYYDSNPPLSYMLYIPVAWLGQLGIPLWYAAEIYTAFIAALSLYLGVRILRGAPELDRTGFCLVLAGYIAAITFPARFEIGQKDHLLAITLFPLVVAQFSIKEKWQVPRGILVAAIILAAPFLLMKPHYGLLPLCAILLRVREWRSIRAIFHFDTVLLTSAAILYTGVVFLFFPDFINEILAVSTKLYVTRINPMLWPAAAGFLLGCLCMIGVALLLKAGPVRRLCVFIGVMAMLAVLAAVLQLKGYSTHFLPPLALLLPAGLLTLKENFSFALLKRHPWVGILGVLAAGYAFLPPPLAYPTHQEYKASSLARYIDDHAQGDPVFFQASSTNVIEPLSAYTGIRLATRFPFPWYLPALLNGADADLSSKFRGYIGEDLRRFKPRFMALYARPVPEQDFLKFAKTDPAFVKEWRHYHKTGQITLNHTEYFAGSPYAARPPIIYDVYTRRD